MQIKGFTYSVPNAASAEEQAKAFLNDYHHLLLTQNAQVEWRLSHVEKDALGRTNVRFSQTYEGLEVYPAELSVHVSKEGEVVVLDGVFIPTPKIDELQPKIQADEAVAKAVSSMPNGLAGKVSNISLIISAAIDAAPRLAWKFDLDMGLSHSWMIVVDALDGRVLKQINRCCSLNAAGSGKDLGNTTRPLNVWASGGSYSLVDTSKPMFNAGNGEGVILIVDAQGANVDMLRDGAPLVIPSSTNPNDWQSPAGVSAAYGLSKVYDYYLEVHQRNSFNGVGSNLLALVNVGGMANAGWYYPQNTMVFGAEGPFPRAIDVVGHEVTHGVAHSIGENGVLEYQYQSGALNEAFADIFGELIEAFENSPNDWILGTVLNTSHQREMIHPENHGQPKKMSGFVSLPNNIDHGGVHKNSGIINHAFYLLAEGLPGAIGKDKAGLIFYRCLTQHMKPLSQFVDARLGCILAAETIYGVNSIESIKVAEAFDSVEIFAYPIRPDEPLGSRHVTSGNDAALFLYHLDSANVYSLGRREQAFSDVPAGRHMGSGLKLARISVSADGAKAAFVSSENRLCVIATADGSLLSQGDPVVHSAAISRDGNYAAFVLLNNQGLRTNQIVVLNLVTHMLETNILTAASFDAASFEAILHADSLNFSPDGKLLIYDAVSSDSLASGGTTVHKSIYALDVETRQQRLILTSVGGLNFGNPTFGHTGNRFITFEAFGNNSISLVYAADLFSGTTILHRLTQASRAYPVYSPDDSGLIFIDHDIGSYSLQSAFWQPLDIDHVTPVGSATNWLVGPSLAVPYRRGVVPTLNSLPTITITSPASGAVFDSPGVFNIEYTAADADGSVQRVELFLGSKIAATKSASQSSFTANGLPAGNYLISLRAYDDLGASTTTQPIALRVQPPLGSARLLTTGPKHFEMTLPISQPGAYRIEASSNLVDWVSIGTVYGSSGSVNFSDLGATNHFRRFYRAVKSQ